MPIVGQQYANGFRPYSSFRVPRGSCGYNNSNSNNTSGNAGQPLSSNGANRTTARTATATRTAATAGNSNGKPNAASSSTCSSSSSSLNQQQQQQGVSNGFTRQQPWRSSYCSSNRHRLPETHLSPHQQQQQRNVKPLTPKLIRRIENTCANNATSSRYGKPRAPAPPANQLLQSRKQNPATGTHQAPAANPSQKRAYQATNGRCAKENCPATTTTRNAQRSSKNYPAPLPPQQQQQQRKQPNDLIAGKATPLAQRRQLPATPKLSLRQRAAPAEGGGSSTGSSDSHDSPKLKKAFSKKFPQGLPFEDEFYGHRNRSYSQSSSNYSFYSSVGAQTTTPHDEDDDEFQRKPATDEALYVDFSKVVHSHKQQRQYVPASSWIRASPDHNELCHRSPTTSHNGAAPLHSTPAQQRRKSAKYARSMHEYLYSDDAKNTTTTMTKHRLSVVDEPEDGYYSYAAGTPEPQTPRTDIYVAAASWAPKPLYPDRVLLPAAADSNNNCSNNNSNLRHSRHQQQQTRRRSEHLGSTTCEYNFDDSLSSSRRRKERSKRSHRKSPATGRRQHKYRYRDEASHSSSRRRHRDRPKDERDSGRNNRQSQAKRYLEKSQLTAQEFENSQIPCYIKMRQLPAPRRIDHYRDLLLECSSLRFTPYTEEDWIVVEYFADHDSDYLVSSH
ncbi:GH20308 [Drosophila grimshawi]|uniref:GH20308 n=1 Tax=Drosophila grimshawi TaxID=7222 RepID=B4JRC7_DROGR|nr:GH20308 [Drosophila grimshawi]